MSISLQIQRLAVESTDINANVLFDSVINVTGNISYDSGTGIITLLEPGLYEFNWWVATQSSVSSNGSGFVLVSSQGDSLIGNSPVKTGAVVGGGIIEVVNTPVTVELRNNSNAEIFYSTIVPVKASLTVIKKNATTGIVIPYSAGITLSTNNDGTPAIANTIAFGYHGDAQIVNDQIDSGSSDTMSFVMPRDGVIQTIISVITVRYPLNLDNATLAVTLQLFSADLSDNFFAAIPGATFTFAPVLTGNVPIGTNILVESPELSIPVARGTRLMLVYSASVSGATSGDIFIYGFASAGIAIL